MSQNSLFFNEDEVIEELRRRGYRVRKEPYSESKAVSNVKDLIEFFYARRRFYNPDRKFPESIDYSEDRNYVGSFVKSRQKLGLGRLSAVREAAEIVDALFKYEHLLNLKEPIRGAVILTIRPIMDRVCGFMNGGIPEAGEIDTELKVLELNSYYDKNFDARDKETAALERQKILEKLNGQDRK